MRAEGIADVNPSNPTLIALLDAGATKALGLHAIAMIEVAIGRESSGGGE
jgi:hypothetical protein